VHELILGGQRSGKSRCAEARAQAWLAVDPVRSALLIANALAHHPASARPRGALA
jgi:adenosylcobinamide kinase/adenosylcobinamide-phosphate guanylyltransferase